MSPQVQVLIGMIASGKSTYARNAAKAGAVIVNDDAIVNAVHGGDYSLYDPSLKPLYKTIENSITSIALAMGRAVVVDRGVNVSSQSRKRWVAIAKSLDVPVTAVAFRNEGPLIHADRRATTDGRGYTYADWLRVAERHNSEWESPQMSEGYNEVIYTTFDLISTGRVFDVGVWD